MQFQLLLTLSKPELRLPYLCILTLYIHRILLDSSGASLWMLKPRFQTHRLDNFPTLTFVLIYVPIPFRKAPTLSSGQGCLFVHPNSVLFLVAPSVLSTHPSSRRNTVIDTVSSTSGVGKSMSDAHCLRCRDLICSCSSGTTVQMKWPTGRRRCVMCSTHGCSGLEILRCTS